MTATRRPAGWRSFASSTNPICTRSAGGCLMTLPPWIPNDHKKDNWQGGPWDRAIQARALEHPGHPVEDHF